MDRIKLAGATTNGAAKVGAVMKVRLVIAVYLTDE
jgi:hypothetical protein